MFRRSVFTLTMLCWLSSAGNSALADVPTTYNVIDLGIAGRVQTIATAINSQGDVAGFSFPSLPTNSRRAFVYRNGVTSDLNMLYPDTQMYASGINAGGQIVGWAYNQTLGYRAFLDNNGTMIDLGKLPGDTSNYYEVQAHAINASGQIAGYSNLNGTTHAFLYSNGAMADLGTPTGCSSSIANAINASGQVAGYGSTTSGVYQAFLYSNGHMTKLGALGGAASVANGINASGQVVGGASTGTYGHAFLYSDGRMNDLGVLAGAQSSTAESINSIGQIVGDCYFPGQGNRAFLYSDGTMRNLNDLVDPALHLKIFSANAINDQGWIAASAAYPNSEQHAILLVPVPEPSTLALLAIGVFGLWLCGWRRR